MLAVLGFLAYGIAGVTPFPALAHCVAKAATGSEPHHHGGQQQTPNDNRENPHGECPHCPPASCTLQSACSDLFMIVLAASPVSDRLLALTERWSDAPSLLLHGSFQPPTPPPQENVRLG